MRRLVVAAGVLPLVACWPAAASTGPEFRLLSEEITESSGLVVSRSQADLAYTVNDSGDSARVFSVDMRSGRVVGETVLAGVEAVDFEALAVAPGRRLLVADIGDNERSRNEVRLYEIDEPGRGDTVVEPRTLRLTYPDSPHDAEAVLVRDGELFVVTKVPFRGAVYSAGRLDDGATTRVLRRVASAPGLVTDATMLADGRVVLRTYALAFVLRDGWRQQGFLRLPRTELGETVAAEPRGPFVYAGSEGERSPVYRVRIPTSFGPTARPPEGPSVSSPDQAVRPDPGAVEDALTRDLMLKGGAVVGGLAVLGLLVRLVRRHR
ncbi:MAG: hypothetical protein GEU96_16630 [Propionibacteriales bacterium]|nr:hypothetical protein [Propionibacteriales bacterium]